MVRDQRAQSPDAAAQGGAAFCFKRTREILVAVQSGFARKRLPLEQNRYFSTLPIRFGDYAAKFAFTPETVAAGEAEDDGGAQLRRTLGQREVAWRFEVQLFVDEERTPIEDPMVEWKSEWTPLGRLTIPRQEVDEAFAAWAEPLAFDPWHALEVFRPLGAMMRARKAAYFTSETVRGAAAEPTGLPG